MTSAVTILRLPQPEASDEAVLKAVRFLGLQPERRSPAQGGPAGQGSVIVASCPAAQAWLAAAGNSVAAAADGVTALLIYGWRDSAECQSLLRLLAGERLRLRPRSNAASRSIAVVGARDVAGPMSGISFQAPAGATGVDFVPEKENPDVLPFILRDGQPFFLRLACGGAEIYLWGTEIVADLDAPVPAGAADAPVNVGLDVFETWRPC